MTRDAAPRRGPRRAPAVVALLAGALLLAGCGGEDEMTADVSDGFAPMPAPAMPEMGFEDSRAGVSIDGGIASDRAAETRAIVRTASLELVVDDGAAAIEAIVARTTEFDGIVASTTLSREEDGTVGGSLVLRVPEARLDEFVDVLDALARAVPYRTVDELDVTLELSDLDAQLVNLRAFEEELRALLTEVRERDGTVEGLVEVLDRLRQIRTEIDFVEGRRIQLSDQVTLSTVYVSVRQARSAIPVVGTWDLPGVVRDALAATVRLGQLVVEGIVWSALTVLPAVAAVGVVVWVVRRARRRRRDAPDQG